MDTWLLVLLAVLAVARLTRLVTTDAIFDRPRGWLVRRTGEDSAASYFIECPWCVSVWLAAPVAWATLTYPHSRWLHIVWLWLAASYVTGVLATRVED